MTVKNALDWLVSPEERAAARRQLVALLTDLLVLAVVLVVVGAFVLGASYAFSFAVESATGALVVVGWLAMFVLAFAALVVAVRAAIAIYARLEA